MKPDNNLDYTYDGDMNICRVDKDADGRITEEEVKEVGDNKIMISLTQDLA